MRFDPARLQFMQAVEVPLAPDEATVGLDIRVVGNDSGEKVGALAGCLVAGCLVAGCLVAGCLVAGCMTYWWFLSGGLVAARWLLAAGLLLPSGSCAS
jgi:hypothetical protein